MTARKVEGIAIPSRVRHPTPIGSRIEARNTTAAEIGLAVIAICEATTAMDSGRVGRIWFSLATSVTTGKAAKAVCPVPAKIVRK